MVANAAASNICRVSSVKRACTVTMSLRASNSSNPTGTHPLALSSSGSANGSWTKTWAPMALTSSATRRPTAPAPTTPIVAARISIPERRGIPVAGHRQRPGRPGESPGKTEQQRQGELGNALQVAARQEDDGNALRGGGGQIDVDRSAAGHADDLQSGGHVQHLGGDRCEVREQHLGVGGEVADAGRVAGRLANAVHRSERFVRPGGLRPDAAHRTARAPELALGRNRQRIRGDEAVAEAQDGDGGVFLGHQAAP